MSPASPHAPATAAATARHGDAAALAAALRDSRRDTLARFADFERALPELRVPQQPGFNPPLWELGHVGWFQEAWTVRQPDRDAGPAADPEAARGPGVRADGDALYDSSRVPHAARWSLPLPPAAATRADLAQQFEAMAQQLARADPSDTGLYLFRLALLHEDMHHEAALYMAQALGVAVADGHWQPRPLPAPARTLDIEAGPWSLGSPAAGFAFDNELPAHALALPASRIDSRVLRWDEYLAFAEDGGYAQPRWWTEEGGAWRSAQRATAPRYLRREGRAWQQWRHGAWGPVDAAGPACHLTLHEAEAWCRWAGRRLPTEAEWERAALTRPADFAWGAVWEWTASAFAPYPGFAPHAYRDYSAPWFGSRRVLRGASFMTQPRMHDPRYRNFFEPARNDIAAGLRSCAGTAGPTPRGGR